MKKLVFTFMDEVGKQTSFTVPAAREDIEADEAKTAGETILGTKVLRSKNGEIKGLEKVEEVETKTKVYFDKNRDQE